MVAALTHDQAWQWTGAWAEVDAAVVDAADDRRAGDQFPGVGLVRHVRAAGVGLVVVVTAHYFHDGLRFRMADAGADLYFLRDDLRSAEELVAAVTEPERHRRGVPPLRDAGELAVLGIGARSDVESFVDYVEGHGIGPDLDPGPAGAPEPRRRWIRHRAGSARAGRIDAVNLTTGAGSPHRDVPSRGQLRRLWRWAARIDRPH